MKVLITGGAGFIGSNLALRLLDKGHTVTVMDNLSSQVHGKEDDSHLFLSIKDKVRFIKGDVRKREDWRKVLDGQDVVVHMAAETGTGQSMYEIERYVDVNIKGTALLLDILANEDYSVKKIVLASSRAVYGEGKYKCEKHGHVYPAGRRGDDVNKGNFESKCPVCNKAAEAVPTDEESNIHPFSIYGITKQVQEQMLLTVARALNISTVILRYQNVYGPGQSLTNPYTGILSIFSTRIKNGKNITIFEDGRESRDFIFIEDAVNATMLGIEKQFEDYELFNVGSGTRTDVLTVAKTLVEKYGSHVDIEVNGKYREGDIRHNYADLSRTKKILGFMPKYDFNAGINRFVEWVNTMKVYNDVYEKSIAEMQKKGLYK